MQISEKYRIIERIGEGQQRKFGDLFIVESKLDGSKHVLKVVSVSSKNLLAQQRLRNEALFSFHFDGLPMILDFVESDTEMILVRNFVKGETLDRFWKQLKKKDRVPFMQAFFERLKPIWKFLHENQIVHCDLKPGNIIIEGSKDDFKISLIDFAMALKTSDVENRELVFPLGFAAPELLLNRLNIIDQRTDIYALGITFWKLWAKELPLTHPNPSIFTNLQLTHPLPGHALIPRQMQHLLERMTVKHQFKIPPNKMEVAEVDHFLLTAMSERISSIDEIIDELHKPHRKWFFLP